MSAISATAAWMRKMGRQPTQSTSGPPTATPTTAAPARTAEASAEARTRSSRGNDLKTMAKVAGMVAAAPSEESVRNAMRLLAFQASAVRTENTTATAIPTR